jgi:hypothetical protein
MARNHVACHPPKKKLPEDMTTGNGNPEAIRQLSQLIKSEA